MEANRQDGNLHMSTKDDKYTPALRYRWLTRFYDPVVAFTSREKVFRSKLLNQLTLGNADRVLDLACGTGTLALKIKHRSPAAVVHGLDSDSDILEQARRKSSNGGLEIHFDQGMSFAMPYQDGYFDVVVSSLFFHHLNVTNKHRTLAEVQRVLKPGGSFVVCDWGKPENPILRLSFYAVQMLDGFDVTRDNVQGRLPEFIATAGFQQVVVADRISTVLGVLDLITSTTPQQSV